MDKIRERAVSNVNKTLRYTFQPVPTGDELRRQYDEELARLLATAGADPGIGICEHEPRHHYQGGGIWICFECFYRLTVGRM
jgi:hypothetical protein